MAQSAPDGVALVSAPHPRALWWRRLFTPRDLDRRALRSEVIVIDDPGYHPEKAKLFWDEVIADRLKEPK